MISRRVGLLFLLHQAAAGQPANIDHVIVIEATASTAIAQHGIDTLQIEAALLR